MKYLIKPIGYVENSDFDQKGNLINETILREQKPIFIMIQANFCHHCSVAKPDFQLFAEKYKNQIICLTIQGDNNDSELAQKISMIYPEFRGFPSYILFTVSSTRFIMNQGRTCEDFENFFRKLRIL